MSCTQSDIDLGGFQLTCSGDDPGECPSGQHCGVDGKCVPIDGGGEGGGQGGGDGGADGQAGEGEGGGGDGGAEGEGAEGEGAEGEGDEGEGAEGEGDEGEGEGAEGEGGEGEGAEGEGGEGTYCEEFCRDMAASCPGGGDDEDDDEGCPEVCPAMVDHFGVGAVECIRDKFENSQDHCEPGGGDKILLGCIAMEDLCERDSQCGDGMICDPFFCMEGERSDCGRFLQCFMDARSEGGDPGLTQQRVKDCFVGAPEEARGQAAGVLGCEELCRRDQDDPARAAAPCDQMGCDDVVDECNHGDEGFAVQCSHAIGCMMMACAAPEPPCFQACGQVDSEQFEAVQRCMETNCRGDGPNDIVGCLAGPCRDAAQACGVSMNVDDGGGDPHRAGPCELVYNCKNDCRGDDPVCPADCERDVDRQTLDDERELRQCAQDEGCDFRNFECIDANCLEEKRACFDHGEPGDPNGGEPQDIPDDVVRLFGSACTNCHPSQSAPDLRAEHIWVTTVNQPANSCGGLPMVEPGNADGSCLIQRMRDDGGEGRQSMPPAGRLPDNEIDLVADWINGLEL